MERLLLAARLPPAAIFTHESDGPRHSTPETNCAEQQTSSGCDSDFITGTCLGRRISCFPSWEPRCFVHDAFGTAVEAANGHDSEKTCRVPGRQFEQNIRHDRLKTELLLAWAGGSLWCGQCEPRPRPAKAPSEYHSTSNDDGNRRATCFVPYDCMIGGFGASSVLGALWLASRIGCRALFAFGDPCIEIRDMVEDARPDLVIRWRLALESHFGQGLRLQSEKRRGLRGRD